MGGGGAAFEHLDGCMKRGIGVAGQGELRPSVVTVFCMVGVGYSKKRLAWLPAVYVASWVPCCGCYVRDIFLRCNSSG